MPNWVENHLRVSAKPELVSEIKEYIKGENGARNACHIDLDTDEPEMFEIRFDTAWSDPEAVIDTLVAKFPEAKFEYYAMEEMGAFYMYGSSVGGVLERNYVEHEDIFNDEAKAAAVARTMREAGMDPDEYNIKNIVDKCDLYFDISDEHGFEGFKGVELELYEYDDSKWARFKKRKPNGKK